MTFEVMPFGLPYLTSWCGNFKGKGFFVVAMENNDGTNKCGVL